MTIGRAVAVTTLIATYNIISSARVTALLKYYYWKISVTLYEYFVITRNQTLYFLALVAATRLKAESCTANGRTLQQALSILCNAPASLRPGHRVV